MTFLLRLAPLVHWHANSTAKQTRTTLMVSLYRLDIRAMECLVPALGECLLDRPRSSALKYNSQRRGHCRDDNREAAEEGMDRSILAARALSHMVAETSLA